MKKLLIFVSLTCTAILLSSCLPERGDWTFDDLPKNYSVWRINSRCIRLLRTSDDNLTGGTVVDAYVSEIAYNDDYIFAKQVSVPEDLHKKIDLSNPSYYIVIVESDEVFGPYTEDEFNTKCEELEISDLPEWIKSTRLKYLN